MSLNPKYVQIASDDLHWVFTGTPTDLANMLENPAGWITTTIPRAKPSSFNHQNIIFSTDAPRGPDVHISGISETSLVIVRDYASAMPAFAEHFGLAGSLHSFWAGLDGVLIKHLASPNIEFVVMEQERLFFVHMQIAPDTRFIAMFLAAISIDPEGYIGWLKDTKGQVPRLARTVSADGAETSIAMDQLRLIPRGTQGGGAMKPIEILYENQVQSSDPAAGLDPEPELIVCSIDNGEMIEKFEEAGIAFFLVEIGGHIIKMYSGDENPPA